MNSLPRNILLLVIAGCALGGSVTPAAAYLDPGSGSLVIQLLLGGVASIALLLKHYWQRLSAMLRPATQSASEREDSDAGSRSESGES